MRLIELHLHRLPGIDDPIHLGADELGEGVHVIHGPNGIGKSSLCRAVFALLWPAAHPAGDVRVEARFAVGEHTWHGRREGTEVQWSRDGLPCPPPPLPDAHLARCHLITLDDLIHEDRDGRWFADRVRHEMAGGFDLPAVRRELFARKYRHGYAEWKEVEAARKLVRRHEGEQERVLAEERELAQREEELTAVEEAARDVEPLRAARDLGVARAGLTAARTALAELPAACGRLAGDEDERLQTLAAEERSLTERARELDAKEAAARAAAEGSGLETPVPAERLDEERARVDALRESERILRGLEEDAAAAKRRLDDVRPRLGPDPDLDRLLSGGELDLAQVEEVHRVHQALENERRELEARFASLGDAAAGDDPDRLTAAIQALRGWLRSPGAARAPRSVAAILVLVMGLALAVVVGLQAHPLGYLLVLPAVGAAIWLHRSAGGTDDRRDTFQAQYASSGFDAPAAWAEDAVARRLDELERRRVEARTAERETDRRRDLERQRGDLDERGRDVEQRREHLRNELGLDVGDSDLALVDFARNLAEARTARTDLVEARGRAREVGRTRDEQVAALTAFLGDHGEEGGDDAIALARALQAVARRSEELTRARADLDHVLGTRADLVPARRRIDKEREAVFVNLDLEPGDRGGLRDLLEARDAFRSAQEEEIAAGAVVRREEARLAGRDEIAALAPEEVTARLEAAREAAAARDARREEIAALRQKVLSARELKNLEEARVEEEQARARLEEEREAAIQNEVGSFLLEGVEEEFERRSRPEVLSRASALFAAFTGGAHGIEVNVAGEGGRLVATDTRRPGLRFDPEELSSGTRAQLLIAVRCALVQGEGGATLPLFVDDALATSDPDRVGAIARAFFALAHDEGRQVLVLTKDAGDLQLVAAAGEADRVREIDLARVRRRQGAEQRRERLAVPPTIPLRSPDGMDGAEYGRLLDVPRFDPWRPLAAAHVFHLFPDDPDLVHDLLTWGVEHLGPLRDLLARGGDLSLGEGARARIEGWADLAEAVHLDWRVGRGVPLDPVVVRACPAISDTFRERVLALAEQVGWNAAVLIEALRGGQVKQFRESKALEARDWFEAKGHLSLDTPLEREEVWKRLVLARELLDADRQPTSDVLRRRFDYLWLRLTGE